MNWINQMKYKYKATTKMSENTTKTNTIENQTRKLYIQFSCGLSKLDNTKIYMSF